MRPVVKLVKKNKSTGLPLEYNPWGKAKSDLVEEIGDFCSYCEKQVNRSLLHIEHIYAKESIDANGDLKYYNQRFSWDNFLLACSNCNSIKGKKDVALTNPFMPHINNLIHFIEVRMGGIISVKNGVSGNNLTRTTSFINLVGLDRNPSHPDYSASDDRWEYRLDTEKIAKRQLEKYTADPKQTDIETIVYLAKTRGFFSVWYYQFLGHNKVLDALINGVIVNGNKVVPFKGTHVNSFKAPSYTTLERP